MESSEVQGQCFSKKREKKVFDHKLQSEYKDKLASVILVRDRAWAPITAARGASLSVKGGEAQMTLAYVYSYEAQMICDAVK